MGVILNEKEYDITKYELESFKNQLYLLKNIEPNIKDYNLLKVYIESIESTIETLKKEIEIYDESNR